MNGVVKVSLENFIVIGLIAFIMVFVLNKGLDFAGYPQFKA